MKALSRDGAVPGEQARADLAAATEQAIVDVLAAKAIAAMRPTGLSDLVVAGGVGANAPLRARLQAGMPTLRGEALFPPLGPCPAKSAMIARAAAPGGLARLVAFYKPDAPVGGRPRR